MVGLIIFGISDSIRIFNRNFELLQSIIFLYFRIRSEKTGPSKQVGEIKMDFRGFRLPTIEAEFKLRPAGE